MGPLAIGGAALGAAGLIGSMLNRPKMDTPDISGELRNLQAVFEKMRAQANANINREAGQGRKSAANNLAARGTLRSPVSEYPFQELEGSRLNAIANSEAQLAGQEAQLRTGLLQSLMGMRQQQQQLRNQGNAQIWGGLTGLGSNLLLAGLLNPAKAGVAGATGAAKAGNFAGSLGYQPDWRQALTARLGLMGFP